MAKNTSALRVTTSIRPDMAARDSSSTKPPKALAICRQEQPVAAPQCAYLGEFEIDLRAGELRAGKVVVLLQEQPFQILRMLLENDPNMVTRHEIEKTLWADGTIVDFDHSINTAVKKLRRAFGDSAHHPRYIETVARRGYRLMVPVRWSQPPLPGPTLADEGSNFSALAQTAGRFVERRLVKDRRAQVFTVGSSEAAVGTTHDPQHGFHQRQRRTGRPVPLAVPHRELDKVLSHLVGRLVIGRLRHLRRSRRYALAALQVTNSK